MLSLFALSFATISFYIDPPFEYDLYRHFEEVDRIRQGGMHYLLNDSIYRSQLGTVLLYYLISLQPNNHFLPFVSVLIVYLILTYMITDHVSNNRLSSNTVFICLTVHFALSDITWTISMIRQPLACAICALAIYLDIIKRKKMSIFVYALGVSVHPGMVGVILVRLAFNFRRMRKVCAVIFLIWGLFAVSIGRILQNSPFYWGRYFGGMLSVYTGTLSAVADLRFLMLKMLMIITILIILLRRSKHTNILIRADRYHEYEQIYILISCFTIGSIVSHQIFLRYVMLISFLFIPLSNRFLPEEGKLKIAIYDICFLFLFMLSIAYQYVALTSHGVKLML